MRKPITLAVTALLFTLSACDGIGGDLAETNSSGDTLVEDAAFMVVLEELDDTSLDSVPAGQIDDAAEDDTASLSEDDVGLERDCSMRAAKRKVIGLYDEDNDGSLSDLETDAIAEDFGPNARRRHHAIRHHRRARLFWVYDEDESGDLDEDERAKLAADLEARCEIRRARLLETYDADDSGDLNESEWEAVRDDRVSRHQQRRKLVMDNFDEDDNGRLDSVERDNFRDEMRARHQARRQDFVNRFDTDESGDLDEEERAIARAEIQARIRGDIQDEDADS